MKKLKSSCPLHSVFGDTGVSALIRCYRDYWGGVILLFSFPLAFPYPSCILGFGGSSSSYIMFCILLY